MKVSKKWIAILEGRHGPRITQCRAIAERETIGKRFCYARYETEALCCQALAERHGEDWSALTRPLPEAPIPLPYATKRQLAASRGHPSHRRHPLATSNREAVASTSFDAPTHSPDGLLLCEEQRQIITRCLQGISCFVTGSAGTGKSGLLATLTDALRKQHFCTPQQRFVAVTATTGIAASLVNGVTLHSWAGCGLAKRSAELLAKRLEGTEAYARWLHTKVLIVDEVSMLNGQLFAKFEHLARLIRRNGLPFGGIQLILCGDFLQLPPVPDWDSKEPAPFAFEMPCWDRCVSQIFVLRSVHRQQSPEFVEILQEIRKGYISPSSLAAFCASPGRWNSSAPTTALYPTRAEARQENLCQLEALSSALHRFRAQDKPGINLVNGDRYLSDCQERACFLNTNLIVEPELQLKVDARVLLLKNLPSYGLHNGSAGTVVGFATIDEVEREAAALKLQQADDHAQDMASDDDYVAEITDFRPTARLENVELLRLRASDSEIERRIFVNDHSTSAILRLGPICPIVQFDINGRRLLLPPVDFPVENTKGEVHAVRYQVPLALAYAMSIHKSQGQTLDTIKIDLASVFEDGQAYVALSRARSIVRSTIIAADCILIAATTGKRTSIAHLCKQCSRQHTGSAMVRAYAVPLIQHDGLGQL